MKHHTHKTFRDISITHKTILLLGTLVLIPFSVLTVVVFSIFYHNRQQSEMETELQRLASSSNVLAGYMDQMEYVMDNLTTNTYVKEVCEGSGSVQRYSEVNYEITDAQTYYPDIFEVQIIRDQELVWEYSKVSRLSNALVRELKVKNAAEQIQAGEFYSVWPAAYQTTTLEHGKNKDGIWVTPFCTAIGSRRGSTVIGTMAILLKEEDFCEYYTDSMVSEYEKAWVVNDSGEVISSTDKALLTEGLPEEFQISGNQKMGYQTVQLKGEKHILYWHKCGGHDTYLVMLCRISHEQNLLIFSWCTLALLLFAAFCIGYLLIYRHMVIRPLEILYQRIHSAKLLELKQEDMEVGNDEIGLLTNEFQDMLHQINELIDQVYVTELKTKEAEKEAMLAQINPHFLYNTINSIYWNALMNEDTEVAEQLEALFVMLKETLNFGSKYTTVVKEIQIIESYCFLLRARFRTEITTIIDVPKEDGVWQIPKLLIQPLVENAYKHGLQEQLGEKIIRIKVRRRRDRLHIWVADNGCGCRAPEIRQKMTEEGEECFALKNIRDRIALEYGNGGNFQFYSRPGQGTVVKLVLPVNPEKNC